MSAAAPPHPTPREEPWWYRDTREGSHDPDDNRPSGYFMAVLPKYPLQIRFFLGPGVRRLYALGVVGGDLGVELGRRERERDLYVGGFLQFTDGVTAVGLHIDHLRGGVFFEPFWGRVRLGAGAQFGAIVMSTPTGRGSLLDFTLGLTLQLSVDVARLNRRDSAIYLGLRTSADLYLAAGFWQGQPELPAILSAMVLVGIRL